MKSPKEKERLALERFLSAINQEFIVEDSESPDFILKDGPKTIGCEITEFAPDYSPKGSKLRAREQFINKLHSKLREKIISEYPLRFSFTISYKPLNPNKSSIDKEVEQVCNILSENKYFSNVNCNTENIRQIFINEIGNFPTACNQMVVSDYLEPMKEWLTPIINSKDKLQEKWTNNYDEKWLIISVGLSRSGDINLKRLVLSEEIGSKKWDKIVLIDIHFSKYVEVNAT